MRYFDGDLWWEQVESLVGPDGSWRAALDGTGVTSSDPLQPRVQQLLGLVGQCGRSRSEARNRDPRQHVEAQHRLRERERSEQRTRQQTGRNIRVREGTLGKRAEPVLQDDRTGGGE